MLCLRAARALGLCLTKREARTVAAVRAIGAVQLRLASELSSEEYISKQSWRDASLERCPMHPAGACGFRRNGTYPRTPAGARVARWYCPEHQGTFSLLPDCLPSRFGGTLPTLEEVVAQREALGVEAAANILRPQDEPAAIDLDSAVEWVRRRATLVHAALHIIIGLLPQVFAGVSPTVTAVRQHLNVAAALPALREIAAAHLHVLPPPLGFGPRPQSRWIRPEHCQQHTGLDPP